MKKISILVIMLSLVGMISAQEYSREKKRAVGFSYSYNIGSGLTYREFINNSFIGFEASAYMVRDIGYRYGFGEASFSLLCQLYQEENSRLYLFQSNTYRFRFNRTDQQDIWNFGVGFGAEFNIWSNISLNAKAGYGLTNNRNRFEFIGGTSLLYNF